MGPVSSLGLARAGGAVTQRPGTMRLLAFDHAKILADGVERATAKLECTREVHETGWDEKLPAGNFHRKVPFDPGFESTG